MTSLTQTGSRTALATLVLFLTLPAAWGGLIVTNSGDQTITEGNSTTVTFTVANTFAFPVILDYAAAIITVGPVDPEDWVHFAGPNGQAGLNTAALVIPAGMKGLFIYNLQTDTADMGPPKDTMNYVDFEAEFSPLGNSGALNGAELNKLNNLLFLNPNQYPAPGSPYLGPGELLYANGIQAQPAPSELIVQVSDTPEPSYLGLSGVVLLMVGLAGRARARCGPKWKH
jgi:hypothetical protein